MKTIAIATLGPSVRLVVFQFLVKNSLVPVAIPPKRASQTPVLPPTSGVEVLKSTPGLLVFPLAMNVTHHYELVDVWQKPHETNWKMSFVRFVFCRKEHVNRNELFHDFLAKRTELLIIFNDLVIKNLWATQAHLNPYFETGSPSGYQVLMLGCAGRIPDTEVFSGGRDETNRGIGPKIQKSLISNYLVLTTHDVVVLMTPEPVPAPVI